MALVDAFEFQKALVAALRAKTTLTALLASLRPASSDTGIYDAVPEGQELDASTFGEDGQALLVDIEIWSADSEHTTASAGSVGYRQPQSIKAIVRDVLLNDTIAVTGGVATVLSVDTPIKQRDDSQLPATRTIVLQASVLLEAS